MAKWRVTPKTQGNTMSATLDDLNVDRDTFGYSITQDVGEVLENAKLDREKEDYFGGDKSYKKAFTIPDVVAIEIKQNHDIDVFDPAFMHDSAQKAKLFAIVETEYPYLKSTNQTIRK